MPGAYHVGCAGWAIPRAAAAHFPGAGSHLERYARVLPAVEINSSFWRDLRPETYARWAARVPPACRFAVKMPREITHVRRLARAARPLARFLAGPARLGAKLGVLLVQLPPGLAFERARAEAFFRALRRRYRRAVACEPRHASWFGALPERLLVRYRVARVAADPVPVAAAAAAVPGGWPRLVYYRLHGSPRRYYSAYDDRFLDRLAATLRARARTASVWCIFDNTAAGAATANALALLERLG